MTANQIAYANYKETKRSNLARETEDKRHNVAGERHNAAVLGESIRHNMAQETHNVNVLQESKRSNLANELLRENTLAETIRANMAREYETHRSNVATETEIRRSNLAREYETYRSNVARENLTRNTLAESIRHNITNESISRTYNTAQNVLREKELEEQKRANTIQEGRYKAESWDRKAKLGVDVVTSVVDTVTGLGKAILASGA